MKQIEQFNHDLNQSDGNRYERWADYRKKIDQFIEPLIKSFKPSEHRLLILGAGNCDDLNLGTLQKYFKSITLADIDLNSVKKGLKKQHLVENDFELIGVDFSGFEKILFFDHLIDEILSCSKEDEIESLLFNKWSGLVDYQFIDSYKNSFDAIIVSPIYTQLVYHQVLNATKVISELNYPSHLIKFIEIRMLDEMPRVIDRFNQNVFHLLKKAGLLFVLSDIFQSRIDEVFYHQITQSIDSLDQMDLLYENYAGTYGYGLGDYGLDSLASLIEPKKHTWIIWPFEEQLHMIVKLECFFISQ